MFTMNGTGRRRRVTRGLGILTVAALVAAACGGDDSSGDTTGADPSDQTTSPAEDSPDETDETTPDAGDTDPTVPPDTDATDPTVPSDVNTDGVLRIAASLDSSIFTLDAADVRSAAPLGLLSPIWGTALKRTETPGQYEPWLVESWEIIEDGTVFVLNFREGTTFQDGEPYDAESFKLGLERTIAGDNGYLDQVLLATIDEMDVVDPRRLELRLNSAVAAQFVEQMASYIGMVGSPLMTDAANAPIGAGPFIVEDFSTDAFLHLRRNDAYFEPERVMLSRVEVSHAGSAEPALNALLADQVDFALINPQAASQLEQQSDYETMVIRTDTHYYFQMCKDRPPFDDVRFRRALQVSLDRQAMNEIVMDGLGLPIVGLWAPGTDYAVPEIEALAEPDLELARQLLEEAGLGDGVEFTFTTTGRLPEQMLVGEVMQAQWAEIGVNVEVIPGLIADVFAVDVPTSPTTGALWTTPGIGKVSRPVVDVDDYYNLCDYQNEDLAQISAELSALPLDDPRAVELWAEAQRIWTEEVPVIQTITKPTVIGHNSRVRGLQPVATAVTNTSSPSPWLLDVYIEG